MIQLFNYGRNHNNDFFRYIDAKYDVYRSFEIKNKKLILEKWDGNPKKIQRTSKREIITPPQLVTEAPRLISVFSSKTYRRGTGGPLVKELGNVHLIVRPLRQALYHRLNVEVGITETFPTWVDGQVVWDEQIVFADSKFEYLLDKPKEALQEFWNNTQKPDGVSKHDWDKHVFSFRSVVFELCVMGDGTGSTLLDLLLDVSSSIDDIGNELNKMSLNPRTPDYKFNCVVCRKEATLKGKEVPFYQSKGLLMPKRCKGCKTQRQ